ncbi:hypothetical protein [Micromonospora sp. NBC_01796]|uniref:hypothetical protein n=1 Tax=Micromonospora sp. NBC_01796 TaxID=2975987 RepID=UPI002DDBBA2D|nr:hypothetical protein [Micromonospora sp. NBC_01796]WSA86831.1 hypothetical protein OIE47_04185 [Micromonospora sp. NBC_01796]
MTDVPVFPVVPLPNVEPGADRRAGIADTIDAWTGSAAMSALLVAFGHPSPLPGPLGPRLDELERFTAEHWNFREGRERHQARRVDFAPEVDELIRAAATSLGLAGRQTPAHRSYDHLLVLGGGVRTSVARADFAASVLRAGVVTGTVAGLGGTRPLVDQEDAVREIGLRDCPTEGDAVDEGLRRAFALGEPTRRRSGETELGEGWWVRSYLDRQPAVHALAVASSRPGQRANTADSLFGWAEMAEPAEGERLLLVTTDLFVPFQHCDAVHMLGLRHGCSIDTVGLDAAVSPWLPPSRTDAVVQEIRSAVLSVRALYRRIEGL